MARFARREQTLYEANSMTEKSITTFPAFDPATLEAFVQTNRTAMKGFEQLSRYFFETASKNFNTAVETSKRLSSVKSLPELAELQSKLSQEFFDTVTERNKTASDLGARMMQDAGVQATMPMPANGGNQPAPVRAQGAKLA
jgi:phasin family protein